VNVKLNSVFFRESLFPHEAHSTTTSRRNVSLSRDVDEKTRGRRWEGEKKRWKSAKKKRPGGCT